MKIIPNSVTVTLSGPTLDPDQDSVTWTGDWAEFANRRCRYSNGNETEYVAIEVDEDDPHIVSKTVGKPLVIGEGAMAHLLTPTVGRETRLLRRAIRDFFQRA